MDQFGIKKAQLEIMDNHVVKMSSTDYKCHLFYKTDNKYDTKPIIHEIRKSSGSPARLHLTYEEMKEKFGENKFYIFES